MSRPRSTALLALIFAVAFAALGGWQLQRLSWKQELIAHMQQRLAAPALDLATWDGSEDLDYRHVALQGRFQNLGLLQLMPRVQDGRVGVHIIGYFEDEQGRLWLVNRGWVAQEELQGSWRYDVLPDTQRLTGIARAPQPPGRFTPANDRTHNRWYFYDPAAMFAAMEVQSLPLLHSLLAKGQTAYVIEADAAPTPEARPLGGVTRLQLSNNHLQYALTWFSLAFFMLLIAGFQLRKR